MMGEEGGEETPSLSPEPWGVTLPCHLDRSCSDCAEGAGQGRRGAGRYQGTPFRRVLSETWSVFI